MGAAIAGKYSFVSQDKFDDYLKSVGIGMIKRKMLNSTAPDIVIVVDGSNVKIDTITSVKTLKLEFVLDTPYDYDPGTGEVGKYVTSIDGNVMVTKKADTGGLQRSVNLQILVLFRPCMEKESMALV